MSLTNKLMKIASFGGVFIIGNALLMRWLIQKRLHDSPYYIQAKDHIMKNKALIDYLGEPVQLGAANLDDNSKNFATTEQAEFSIPLKGKKHEGMLYFNAIRNPEYVENNSSNTDNANCTSRNNVWLINRLEVTVNDRPNEKLVLVGDKNAINQAVSQCNTSNG